MRTNVTALLERANKDIQTVLSALKKSYGENGDTEVIAEPDAIERLLDTIVLFKQEVGDITYK